MWLHRETEQKDLTKQHSCWVGYNSSQRKTKQHSCWVGHRSSQRKTNMTRTFKRYDYLVMRPGPSSRIVVTSCHYTQITVNLCWGIGACTLGKIEKLRPVWESEDKRRLTWSFANFTLAQLVILVQDVNPLCNQRPLWRSSDPKDKPEHCLRWIARWVQKLSKYQKAWFKLHHP
jgi:hypothetical protein